MRNPQSWPRNKVRDILDAGSTRILFDFDGLEYISSAGLRVILMTIKELRSEEWQGRAVRVERICPGSVRGQQLRVYHSHHRHRRRRARNAVPDLSLFSLTILYLSRFRLTQIIQPLSGEYAGYRELSEKITFPIGYGIETVIIFDI